MDEEFYASNNSVPTRLFHFYHAIFSLQHLVDLFPDHIQEWRTVFESEDPQKETIPLENDEVLTRMQLLCVLRCLRPDKVVAAVQDYVAGVL